jgi:hypothetical protein
MKTIMVIETTYHLFNWVSLQAYALAMTGYSRGIKLKLDMPTRL